MTFVAPSSEDAKGNGDASDVPTDMRDDNAASTRGFRPERVRRQAE